MENDAKGFGNCSWESFQFYIQCLKYLRLISNPYVFKKDEKKKKKKKIIITREFSPKTKKFFHLSSVFLSFHPIRNKAARKDINKWQEEKNWKYNNNDGKAVRKIPIQDEKIPKILLVLF